MNQENSIHEIEKQALVGDQMSIIRIVSDFRKLRAESHDLLNKRYSDGECDAVALYQFESALETIEDPEGV